MSIENNLKRIADALEILAANGKVEEVKQVVEQTAPPEPPKPATPAAPVPPVPQAPAATNIPFSDIGGLVQYVTNKYKELGPEKGSNIQNILVGLGYGNINDIKPEHFGDFYNQVEAL